LNMNQSGHCPHCGAPLFIEKNTITPLPNVLYTCSCTELHSQRDLRKENS